MKTKISISEKLRKRRHEYGLSLSELARLSDTSPATLSRYENNWTRFEISTLRKLAVALNCRLEINLVPNENSIYTKVSKSDLIRSLTRLFWDADFNYEILYRYPVWAVERVLESGQLEDIYALQTLLGRDAFLDAVQKTTRLSEKERCFWNSILMKEGMQCMKKSSRVKALNS